MEYTREELFQQAGSEEAVEDYIITRFQKTMSINSISVEYQVKL